MTCLRCSSALDTDGSLSWCGSCGWEPGDAPLSVSALPISARPTHKNKYNRAHYLANREEFARKAAAFRASHREELREYHRSYYAAHREQINQRHRDWRKGKARA